MEIFKLYSYSYHQIQLLRAPTQSYDFLSLRSFIRNTRRYLYLLAKTNHPPSAQTVLCTTYQFMTNKTTHSAVGHFLRNLYHLIWIKTNKKIPFTMYRYAIGQPNGSPYYLIPIQYYNNILKNDQIKKNQVKVRELYLDQFTAVRNTKSIQT